MQVKFFIRLCSD